MYNFSINLERRKKPMDDIIYEIVGIEHVNYVSSKTKNKSMVIPFIVHMKK